MNDTGKKPVVKQRADIALIQLLPNILTIGAICAGITSIRFAVQGNFLLAVQLILLASVLDGLDGRLARLLGSDSKMGAELDSLADFLNFGVAPPLVIYFWGLQSTGSAAWIAVLTFAVCCVVRLARFNVSTKSERSDASSEFFTGIPAPAGALLAMLPMYTSFAFSDEPLFPGLVISLFMVAIGLLMISRIPVWSFKTLRISRENVRYVLVGFAFTAAVLLTFEWFTLVVICFVYTGLVVWAYFAKYPA